MKLSEFIRSNGFDPKDLSDDQLDSIAEWHCASAASQGGEADGNDDLRKVDASRRHARIQEIESLCAGFPGISNKAVLGNWSNGKIAAELRALSRPQI